MFQQRQQAWQDPAFVQQAQHAVQSVARQSWVTADIGTYALKALFDYYREKSNQWRDHIQLANRLALLQAAVHTKEKESKKSKKKKKEKMLLQIPLFLLAQRTTFLTTWSCCTKENFKKPAHRMACYPNITYQDKDVGVGCCCNFLVHSPQRRQAYFFARIAGVGSLCRLVVPPEEKEDNEQQQPLFVGTCVFVAVITKPVILLYLLLYVYQ
ncbi:hypothetical protein ACA910_001744 [Epithemia clementina (nom. ined.)]